MKVLRANQTVFFVLFCFVLINHDENIAVLLTWSTFENFKIFNISNLHKMVSTFSLIGIFCEWRFLEDG